MNSYRVTWIQGQCSVSEGLDVFVIMSHNRPLGGVSHSHVFCFFGSVVVFFSIVLMSQHLAPVHVELVIQHLKKLCVFIQSMSSLDEVTALF